MKYFPIVFLISSLFTGCQRTADDKEQAHQEVLQAEAQRQAGLPNVVNFTEKKMMKQIYELRDSQIRTWTYLVDLNGKKHLLCESLGYGLPYGTQYSNPQKRVVNAAGGKENFTITQAEPNGLFMPPSAEGTWVMAVTPDGPRPIYVEPRIIVSPIRIPNVDESESLSSGKSVSGKQ